MKLVMGKQKIVFFMQLWLGLVSNYAWVENLEFLCRNRTMLSISLLDFLLKATSKISIVLMSSYEVAVLRV